MRVIGDTVFALGAFSIVAFVFGLAGGQSYRRGKAVEVETIPAAAPSAP
jgi:hypothetical protein